MSACKSLVKLAAVTWMVGATAMADHPVSEPKQATAGEPVHTSADKGVPAWARDAFWYEVFVARFANGDKTNDPPKTQTWAADWPVSPPADASFDPAEYNNMRFGGDLQGLTARLNYLRDLDVNTLYLTPIFAAGSEHKYDTIDLRHIDDSFGIAGSIAQVTGETLDPKTWQFSASDRVFIDFVAQAHKLGIRVVLDGVFGHVGKDFWAFRDVMKNGKASPYAGWFDVTSFGPPLTWNAWDGFGGNLVRFKRTKDGLAPAVEKHIFDIAKRWMDPNGDGDPKDGIDGWRVDAADTIPHGFWKRFRKHVKRINPKAIIVGEIWEDADAWLAGDEFDVVTDYRFAHAVERFFGPGNKGYTLKSFFDDLEKARGRLSQDANIATINLLGSHDTARFLAKMAAKPIHKVADADARLEFGKPSERAIDRWRLATVFQFFYPGAPMIYYGDEVGMYADTDPFCRGPMWWNDLRSPSQSARQYRLDMLSLVKLLSGRRIWHEPLRRGDFRVVLLDEQRKVLAFARWIPGHEVILVMNYGDAAQRVDVAVGTPGEAVGILSPQIRPGRRGHNLNIGGSRQLVRQDGTINLPLEPRSFRVVLAWDDLPK